MWGVCSPLPTSSGPWILHRMGKVVSSPTLTLHLHPTCTADPQGFRLCPLHPKGLCSWKWAPKWDFHGGYGQTDLAPTPSPVCHLKPRPCPRHTPCPTAGAMAGLTSFLGSFLGGHEGDEAAGDRARAAADPKHPLSQGPAGEGDNVREVPAASQHPQPGPRGQSPVLGGRRGKS